VGSRGDVVEDGRIGGIVEGLAADVAIRIGCDQPLAELSVLAVAGDGRHLVIRASGLAWSCDFEAAAADEAGSADH
jgi:hypothetical protein